MPLDNLTELKRRVPGGKYVLARAIAERARQLQSGESIPLVEVKTPNPLTVAIDEIVQGKVTFDINKPTEHRTPDEMPTEEETEAVAVSAGVAAPESVDEALFAVSDEADDAIAPDAGAQAEVDKTVA